MISCMFSYGGALLAACACTVATVVRAQDLSGQRGGRGHEHRRRPADRRRHRRHLRPWPTGHAPIPRDDSCSAGVRFGSQRVEIRAIGYQPSAHAVTVVPGEVARLEVRLKPAVVNSARSRGEQQPGGAARLRHAGQRRGDSGRGDPRDPRPPPGGDRQSHARRLREQLRRRGACHRHPPADHHQGAVRLSRGRGPDPVHRLLQPQRPLRDQHPAGRTARGDQGPGHRRVRQRRGGRRGERLHPGPVAAPRGRGVPRGRQQHLCPRPGNGEHARSAGAGSAPT